MRLHFDSKGTKRLFLMYAVPCGDVLVRRKTINKAKLNRIKSDLSDMYVYKYVNIISKCVIND